MASPPLALSDGGVETALIYLQGIELSDFAAFPLLDEEAGRAALAAYYVPFLRLAEAEDRAFVLATPTWRASSRSQLTESALMRWSVPAS